MFRDLKIDIFLQASDNGYMPVAIDLKRKSIAVSLRKQGYSLGEISQILSFSKSTASVLLKNVTLDKQASKRINQIRLESHQKALKTLSKRRTEILDTIKCSAMSELSNINLKSKSTLKLISSLLYWGEGGKKDSYVSFINSDPKMVSSFLKTLRSSFHLDERKFRALIHIHDYHSDEELKRYWSNITKIPVSQFTKSYEKSHNGKNKHLNYMGTIKIKYFDYKIALELKYLYNSLAENLGL